MKAKFINRFEQIPIGCRVGLYGAGDGGARFKGMLEVRRRDVAIACFVDDHKTGVRSGLRIVNPIDSLNMKKLDCLLVTSAFWPMIKERLDDLGIRNYFIVNPLLYYDYLIFNADEARKYSVFFKNTEQLLEDKRERYLYRLLIGARMRNPEGLVKLYNRVKSQRMQSSQYLDFLPWGKIHTVIEGGVFNGKDTLNFSRKTGAKGFIYGFDPLYKNIQSSFKKDLKNKKNIKIYPHLLWSKGGLIPFWNSRDNPEGSGIVFGRKGAEKLKTVTIDDFVREKRIEKLDFIKLDVEGSEMDVLKGGLVVIRTHRPSLAVSIYHRKQDMFAIPLFLSKMLKGYTYHLAHYSKTFWDTVWYAIPN